MGAERVATQTPGPDVLQANTLVAGRYRLGRLLGQGGMGLVWSATHAVTRRGVALKVLRDAFESEHARQRFVREGRMACAVQHPNIVEVLDFLELDDGTPAMAMELLTGESLGERLAKKELLSVHETADLLLPVASAVAAAHARGIVHRDLKPDNIFLHMGSDGSLVVKVLDFGIAKVTGIDHATTASLGLTATGALLGTPMYMSPEQVFGEKDIDHRSDVWSLGIILYRCLSGVLPTHADNMGQVLKMVVSGRILPLGKFAPDLPRDLSAMVDSMLSRDRGKRPQHLGPVIELLKKYSSVQVPPFREPSGRFHTAAAGQALSEQAMGEATGRVDEPDVLGAGTVRPGGTLRARMTPILAAVAGAAAAGVVVLGIVRLTNDAATDVEQRGVAPAALETGDALRANTPVASASAPVFSGPEVPSAAPSGTQPTAAGRPAVSARAARGPVPPPTTPEPAASPSVPAPPRTSQGGVIDVPPF